MRLNEEKSAGETEPTGAETKQWGDETTPSAAPNLSEKPAAGKGDVPSPEQILAALQASAPDWLHSQTEAPPWPKWLDGFSLHAAVSQLTICKYGRPIRCRLMRIDFAGRPIRFEMRGVEMRSTWRVLGFFLN